MEGSSSYGCPRSQARVYWPKCRHRIELEQQVSRSERNFLRPYFSCMKCGCFICWVEEEGRGQSKQPFSQSRNISCRGRVSVESFQLELINLKDKVSGVLKEMAEMRHEMRSLLMKIYDVLKVIVLLCAGIFLVCVVMKGVFK